MCHDLWGACTPRLDDVLDGRALLDGWTLLLSCGPDACHRLGGRLVGRTSLLCGHLGDCGTLEGCAVRLIGRLKGG